MIFFRNIGSKTRCQARFSYFFEISLNIFCTSRGWTRRAWWPDWRFSRSSGRPSSKLGETKLKVDANLDDI